MRVRAVLSAAVLCAAFVAGAPLAHAAAQPAPACVTTAPPLICIDPGHGGPFSNANANGLKERTVNLQVGLALRDALLSRGYRVIMTRTTNTALMIRDTETWNLKNATLWDYAKDKTLYRSQSIPKDDLTARTRVANDAGADLLVSIHCNGAKSKKAKGIETWASPRDAAGKRLARAVQSALTKRTRLTNRGAKSADFYVLRWSNMPAILVECAFISNRSDAAYLKSSRGRSEIASGIADGVDAWFASTPLRQIYPRLSAGSQSDAAIAVSQLDFPLGAGTVVLARSDRATDTPGAPALAARVGGALLLASGSLPSTSTLAELARLHPSRVLLVGLEGSFDATGVARALDGSGVPASAVVSVEATDRAVLAARIAELMGAPGCGRVILVNEKDDGALMAVAPIAAWTGNPILLTSDTTVGPAAAYLDAHAGLVGQVLRVGSQFAPAPYSGQASQHSLRYADPARILRVLNNETYTASALSLVVTSELRPGDVLTASLHAARVQQPVVLVSGTRMSPYARLYITNKRTQTKSFWLLESRGSLPLLVDALLAKSDAL